MTALIQPVGPAACVISASGPPFSLVYPKPVLKWAGGKRDQVDTLIWRMDKLLHGQTIDRYYEPFAGGAALFFALAGRGRVTHAFLSDTNAELIGMYTSLRDEVHHVIEALDDLSKRAPSEKKFYEIRDWRPRAAAKRAARMIYLNKTCFNGLYRVNSSGKFNVPYGKPKPSVKIYDVDNLCAVSKALQGVRIEVRPYQDSFDIWAHSPWDFTYLDPPYFPISKTSNFRAYQKAGFGLKDQQELAARFRVYAQRGGLGLLSNSHCPETLKLYKGLIRHRIAAKRSISANGTKRGMVSELLVESRFRK